MIEQILQRLSSWCVLHAFALQLFRPGQKLLPVWHGVQLALLVFLISTQVLDLCLQRIEWLVQRHRTSGDDPADVMVFPYRLDDIDKLAPCASLYQRVQA